MTPARAAQCATTPKVSNEFFWPGIRGFNSWKDWRESALCLPSCPQCSLCLCGEIFYGGVMLDE